MTGGVECEFGCGSVQERRTTRLPAGNISICLPAFFLADVFPSFVFIFRSEYVRSTITGTYSVLVGCRLRCVCFFSVLGSVNTIYRSNEKKILIATGAPSPCPTCSSGAPMINTAISKHCDRPLQLKKCPGTRGSTQPHARSEVSRSYRTPVR